MEQKRLCDRMNERAGPQKHARGNSRIEQNWMEYSRRMERAGEWKERAGEWKNGRMEWREENRAVDGAEQNGTEEVGF